jgi:hypothetical protein
VNSTRFYLDWNLNIWRCEAWTETLGLVFDLDRIPDQRDPCNACMVTCYRNASMLMQLGCGERCGAGAGAWRYQSGGRISVSARRAVISPRGGGAADTETDHRERPKCGPCRRLDRALIALVARLRCPGSGIALRRFLTQQAAQALCDKFPGQAVAEFVPVPCPRPRV